ncbi:hypothetical protein B0H11DRAFT_2207685 [Mycena galericulata]|nr:hypothetical protein B0H11DRAFT_2207685 [Mycena galericulata]
MNLFWDFNTYACLLGASAEYDTRSKDLRCCGIFGFGGCFLSPDLFSIATPSLPTRLQFDTAARPAPPTTYRNYAPTPSSLNFLLVASKTRHCDSCGAHHSIITRHLATNTLNIARPLFPAKLAVPSTPRPTRTDLKLLEGLLDFLKGSRFDAPTLQRGAPVSMNGTGTTLISHTRPSSNQPRLVLFYFIVDYLLTLTPTPLALHFMVQTPRLLANSLRLMLHGQDTGIIVEPSQVSAFSKTDFHPKSRVAETMFEFAYAASRTHSDGRNAGVIVEPYQATVLTTSPGMPILLQLVRLDDWVPVLWSDDTRYRTREAESMPGFPVCRGTGPSHVHFNVEPSLLCQKPMSVKFYSFEVWSFILEPYQFNDADFIFLDLEALILRSESRNAETMAAARIEAGEEIIHYTPSMVGWYKKPRSGGRDYTQIILVCRMLVRFNTAMVIAFLHDVNSELTLLTLAIALSQSEGLVIIYQGISEPHLTPFKNSSQSEGLEINYQGLSELLESFPGNILEVTKSCFFFNIESTHFVSEAKKLANSESKVIQSAGFAQQPPSRAPSAHPNHILLPPGPKNRSDGFVQAPWVVYMVLYPSTPVPSLSESLQSYITLATERLRSASVAELHPNSLILYFQLKSAISTWDFYGANPP